MGSVQGLIGRGVLGCWLHEERAGPLFRAGGWEGLLLPRALLFGLLLHTDSDGCRHAVFFLLPKGTPGGPARAQAVLLRGAAGWDFHEPVCVHWCLCADGPPLSLLKCFRKLCPAWEAEEATGAGTKGVLFHGQWPGSGFCFHTCSKKATFRSGEIIQDLRKIIQDARIKMSLLLSGRNKMMEW